MYVLRGILGAMVHADFGEIHIEFKWDGVTVVAGVGRAVQRTGMSREGVVGGFGVRGESRSRTSGEGL